MRQTVGQRRHLKLKNHQDISSVCPWCVDCVSNLRLVSACQTFPTPPCTTRRARSASTSPSVPGGMDEMDKISHVSLGLSTCSAFGRYHQILIRSHIGSYRISSDQTIDFLSIDVPIIFESFIEILWNPEVSKKNNVLPWWSPTQATSDSDRDARAEEIRRDFEPHKAMKMTRDDKHTEMPRCYDLWVITAHAWLYIIIYIYIFWQIVQEMISNFNGFLMFLASERYVIPWRSQRLYTKSNPSGVRCQEMPWPTEVACSEVAACIPSIPTTWPAHFNPPGLIPSTAQCTAMCAHLAIHGTTTFIDS